ncbi:hypothetical protein BDC45DRAFT_57390 [Circinella umbellata]|nr:hypothetical protein BDC45DRAFT_57390 [Circinella umbellata]
MAPTMQNLPIYMTMIMVILLIQRPSQQKKTNLHHLKHPKEILDHPLMKDPEVLSHLKKILDHPLMVNQEVLNHPTMMFAHLPMVNQEALRFVHLPMVIQEVLRFVHLPMVIQEVLRFVHLPTVIQESLNPLKMVIAHPHLLHQLITLVINQLLLNRPKVVNVVHKSL